MISLSFLGVLEPSVEAKLSDLFLNLLKRSSFSNSEPNLLVVVGGVCGATDAVLFFLVFAVGSLTLLQLELADTDAVVIEDAEDIVPGTKDKLFFFEIVTEKFSQLQNGHAESFSFWGLTCR
ncbi:unnamed protein product [Pseudo-nitzschia multistriata]|uniref:Uncharacterized protein n=1 Tax=Pseudo-nitzschia multistriata TaxID=183589 RepID=A0A448Z0U3_9STRA|nr:unnamed protein product [Pseudo-nitzschia multistriata]